MCESDDYEKFYRVIKEYALFKCQRCGLVFLKDAPDEIFKMDFIQQAKEGLVSNHKERVEYFSFPHLYNKYRSIFDGFFEERFCRIKKYSSFSSMLDVGCGYGFWMKYCADRGIEVDGFDMSREVVDWMTENFCLKGTVCVIEEFETDKKYDCVVLCDILEHVIEPGKEIRRFGKMLNENGIMYIQLPSIIGFKFPRSQGHDLPFHIWQFNFHALKKLIEKNGFSLMDWRTGVTGVIGVYEDNCGRAPFLKRLEWQIARSLKIGNRLQMIIKRKV
ncbi:MAG: hypothetical protein A2909_02210 [Candidatus Tagabacteria bacterium RIFCSPLOWO2_01_FULL_39_11]|uniref:Class I SAM-dependent methyltransferase n=1 Tax=Candidatus Tagabacteria bacterium RIFCSPLOWO2_01_FULL_39_11 TaxID=1802295 RepID=A0A1G2LS40_9BACT|nr:MAG: hypothetical protein A2909_02210 [Candidatus Tagabacteria bacterium RIFCSPLOWO2_01_FULL_39_11]